MGSLTRELGISSSRRIRSMGHAQQFYNDLYGHDGDVVPEWIWKRWTRDDLENLEEIIELMMDILIDKGVEWTLGLVIADDITEPN